LISTINIKGVASYNHTTGVDILDLKNLNYFFGFNGAGKSTIAKYLRNISLDTANQNQDFQNCSCTGYNSTQSQILVFNEEFIDENFRQNSELKGVFSLNQTNATIDTQIASQQSIIDSYQERKDIYNNRIIHFQSLIGEERQNLLNKCWNERNSFNTFTKFNLQHAGSKPNHFSRIEEILTTPFNSVALLESLKNDYDNFYEKDIEEVSILFNAAHYRDLRRIEQKLTAILDEIIVGTTDVDIAETIDAINSRNWIEQGQEFVKEENDTCPFCQEETITSDLRSKFLRLFDETYQAKKDEIKNLKTLYKTNVELVKSNLVSIQNEFNPENIISNLLLEINGQVESNIRIIDEKLLATNEKKSITSISTLIQKLKNVVKSISDNNKLDAELDEKKDKMQDELWLHMAAKSQHSILSNNQRKGRLEGLITTANSRITGFESNIETAKQLIETLRSQTVNTTEAVEKINIVLSNCGFEGFEIVEKDSQNNISRYFLKRPNTTANEFIFNSLSEGEKNFISFLYFYQLCLGTDDIAANSSKKKIIVIDDPVSSLDSQSLFIVSTLIHSLIQRKSNTNTERKQFKNEQISQVFILTHNIYFYKEVSFERRPMCTNFWHYKISKVNNSTSVSGSYNKTVKDDYSLMWNTLKEIKSNMPTDSSLNIMISNVMRRIIESYVNFIGYGNDSWSSLQVEDLSDPSFYIKSAFISTINDESHKVHAMDSTYYQKIIHEQPQILFNVFGSIFKTIGKTHYELQMDEVLN